VDGIIRVGATIKEGDILIGKITPKGESDPTPEEKLLRAIFGDKAGDVKDASLKAPPSINGVVIGTRFSARKRKDKDSKSREKMALDKLDKDHQKVLDDIRKVLVEKLMILLKDKKSAGVFNKFKEE
jgi:DNA-directed RNA polymerase subunit beta